jgi:hypothetical protein
MTVAADEQHDISRRQWSDRENVGPGVARGDDRRRRGAGRQRFQHRRIRNIDARARERDVAVQHHGPVGRELLAHTVDQALDELVA